MDTSPPRVHDAAPPQTGDAARRHSAARIYYLHPLLAGAVDGWDRMLAHAAALGFDHVLIAPPFAAGRTGDLLLTGDADRLDPRLLPSGGVGAGATAAEAEADEGLRRIAALCRASGLELLLDVVLDRVAEGGALAMQLPDVFTPPLAGAVVDPRHDLGGAGAAYARLDQDAAVAWWAARLGRLARAGAAGFRLLGLSHLPPDRAAALVAAARGAAPDARLLAWTPGMAEPDRAAMPAVDDAFGSLPWWDYRAGWFWRECRELRRLGRLGAAVAAPFETAAPADAAAARRAIRWAAGMGGTWLLPMGFEFGAPRPLDPVRDSAADWARLRADPAYDLTADIVAANAAWATTPAAPPEGALLPLTAPGSTAAALFAGDAADPRRATAARVMVANASLDMAARLDAAVLLNGSGAVLGALRPVLPDTAPALAAGETLVLAPGEVRWLDAETAPVPTAAPDLRQTAGAALAVPRIGIEAITPSVEHGRFPARRIAGDSVTVEADIIYDGHEQFAAALLWRAAGAAAWQETRMRPLGNDRWQARFPLPTLGLHEYTVEAWHDRFGTWRDEVAKKSAAGVDTHVELIEGRHLLLEHAGHAGTDPDAAALRDLHARVETLDDAAQRALLLSDDTAALMARTDPRAHRVRHAPALPLRADRPGAAFASWYEVFPRSMSDDSERHGTFDDVIRHLPRVRAMGFDVLYFPPIHPIGRTNRKGRNNSLRAGPDDVGSPYAIGAAEGGHDALHPALGSLADFRRLVAAAAAHGLELAIDFAIQCSPDHPWLREHKGWFAWRPDGSMKYAENPPKKYEDIVNVDFYAREAMPDLWIALCEVVLFWCEQGVRLFRVDNPHTKPLPFWEWMIAQVQARHPDAVFLAEAFTRPKVMYRLAKAGFGQSYTYFTWRNSKRELAEYLTELSTSAPRDFFRPHFFVNTPDINPPFLQTGGRPAHLIRAALAATLSGLWGVYSGFELCEATPLPGREEYLDSEKYQIRAWDWQRPGNIVADITALNALRRENPALQTHLNVRFIPADDEAVLAYVKATEDRANVLVIAVSLDPFAPRAAELELPLWTWGLPDSASILMEDLIDGGLDTWHGARRRVTLLPDRPYAIWRARLSG